MKVGRCCLSARPLLFIWQDKQIPMATHRKEGMIEQMATLLLSSPVLARQTMLQVCKMSILDEGPVPGVHHHIYSSSSFRCSFTQASLFLDLILPYHRLFHTIPSLLVHLMPQISWHEVIHKQVRRTAAKEKAYISVSLRGLSRWLLW